VSPRWKIRAWQAALPATALLVGGMMVAWARSVVRVPVEIRFAATALGAPFSCGDEQPQGAPPAGAFAGQDLRFYVHDVALLDASGAAVPVQLEQDDVAQNGDLALLDFEDGAGRCDDGTRLVHTTLRGTVPPGQYGGLRFTLGVPFARNHADPAQAAPPLNLGRMSWGWQGGYKFLRFEGASGDGTPVRFHLGSTGCSGTIGHVDACARPNRVVVQLVPFVAARDQVLVTLDPLIAGAAGKDGRLCMSQPDDPGCVAAFAALGLEPASGEQRTPQRLFSVVRS
jgi:uncharacterized repeat protein (TIGR04052 family)